jgi:hypothetical protein
MESHFSRLIRLSCGALTLIAAAACGDASLAPDRTMSAPRAMNSSEYTPPPMQPTEGMPRYNLLQRTSALDRYYWNGAWIYPDANSYQTIKIQQAGIKVSFPPNSVTAPVYVTIVAHPGKNVSYEFFPHGTTFNEPIKIQQDLHGTTAYHNATIMSNLVAGYLVNGWYDIDFATGSAPIAELFPVVFFDETEDFKKTTPAVVKFYTKHFSGYTLASGVRSMTMAGQ